MIWFILKKKKMYFFQYPRTTLPPENGFLTVEVSPKWPQHPKVFLQLPRHPHQRRAAQGHLFQVGAISRGEPGNANNHRDKTGKRHLSHCEMS